MNRTTGLFCSLCLAVLLWGCEEERFRVPKKKRIDHGQYKTRMLATRQAPLPRKPTKQPGTPPKGLEIRSNYGHHGRLLSFAMAPSGLRVLTGDAHHQVLGWGLGTKDKLPHRWGRMTGPIRQIAYGPAGRRVALLEGAKTLSLWSASGTLLKRSSSPSPLTALRFAPISNQLLGLGEGGALRVFHGSSLRVVRQHQACAKGHGAPRSLDIDAHQQWLVVGCASGLWLARFSGAGGQRIAMKSPVDAASFSPTKPLLAAGSRDGKLHLWRWDPNAKALHRLHSVQGHLRGVTQLSFSPDGTRLISGGLDRQVGIWKVIDGPKLKLQRRLEHAGAIAGLAWAGPEDNARFVSADARGHLRSWSTKGARLMLRSPAPIRGGSVAFNPRRPWLVSHADQGFAVWDLRHGNRFLASTVHPHALLALQFAIDGNHLLAVDRDNAVFWDLNRRRYIDVINPPKGSRITAATLGNDWTQVFLGTPRDGVYLWTIAGKRLLYRHTTPAFVTSVAFHRGSQRAIAATLHGDLYLYDMRARRFLKKLSWKGRMISQVRFAPDGHSFLTLSHRKARLWSWSKPAEVREIQHHSRLLTARFRGKRVALGSADHGVWWWEPQRKKLRAGPRPCQSDIRSIDFKGKHMAVACEDGAVHLWKGNALLSTHVPLTGKEWITFTPKLHFIGSPLALRHFSLAAGKKRHPMLGFGGRFFAPKEVFRAMGL